MSTVDFQPLHDLVLIERNEQPIECTASGLFIPNNAKEKPLEGQVVGLGPGRWNFTTGEREPMQVAIGDWVLFNKYAGTEITVQGREFLLMPEPEIVSILVR